MGCCESKSDGPPKRRAAASSRPSKAQESERGTVTASARDADEDVALPEWVAAPVEDVSDANVEDGDMAEVHGEVFLVSHAGRVVELVTHARGKQDDGGVSLLSTAMLVSNSPYWAPLSDVLRHYSSAVLPHTHALVFLPPKEVTVTCVDPPSSRTYTLTPFRPVKPSRLLRDFHIPKKGRHKLVSSERGRVVVPSEELQVRKAGSLLISYNAVRDKEHVHLVSWHDRVTVQLLGDGERSDIVLAVPEGGDVEAAFREQVAGPCVPFELAEADGRYEARLKEKTVTIIDPDTDEERSVTLTPTSKVLAWAEQLAATPAALHTRKTPDGEPPTPLAYNCVSDNETYYAVKKKNVTYVNDVPFAHNTRNELMQSISAVFDVHVSNMVLEGADGRATLRVEKLSVTGDPRERGRSPAGDTVKVSAFTKAEVAAAVGIPEAAFWLKQTGKRRDSATGNAGSMVLVPLALSVAVVMGDVSKDGTTEIHAGSPHRGNVRKAVESAGAMPLAHIESSEFSVSYGGTDMTDVTWFAVASMQAQHGFKVLKVCVLPKTVEVHVPGRPAVQLDIFYGESEQRTFRRLVEVAGLQGLCRDLQVPLEEVSTDQPLLHQTLPARGGRIDVALPVKRVVLQSHETATHCAALHPHWAAQDVASRLQCQPKAFSDVPPGAHLTYHVDKHIQVEVVLAPDVVDTASVVVRHGESLPEVVKEMYDVGSVKCTLKSRGGDACTSADLQYSALQVASIYTVTVQWG